MLNELRVGHDASESWKIFEHEVSSQTQHVRDGLYVFYLANRFDKPVRDGNIGWEKTVIHPAGASIKPGKFEGGFHRRLGNYQKDLHWLGEQGEWNRIFTRCFRFALLLDLSQCDLGFNSSARIFEQYWNQSVYSFLAAQSLWAPPHIKQNKRSEWHYIDHQAWSSDIEQDFIVFMRDCSERIMKMAAIGSPR